MKQIKLMLGDNIESLKLLEDNSVDSVVIYRHIRLDTNETFYKVFM